MKCDEVIFLPQPFYFLDLKRKSEILYLDYDEESLNKMSKFEIYYEHWRGAHLKAHMYVEPHVVLNENASCNFFFTSNTRAMTYNL